MSHTEDNKRIARNTIYLYLRSLFAMIVSLYTSRLILEVLGFTDHGIYNLIGSVVVMFNMFSATFVSATQRFLNFALGKNDIPMARLIFSASVKIHASLACIIVVFLETIGVWFINNQLNIPIDRMNAANIVYQFSIICFGINLFIIPYNAIIVAKEKMHIFALVSIYENISKLVIVIYLSFVNFDRLILYGFLLMLIPVSILIFYMSFCRKKYRECFFVRHIDKSVYKEMLCISGWNFLGSGATIATVSGMGVIINLFTDVIVNSAKGISSQVETVVKQLVDNFMTSVRPQITKSYAAGDIKYLNTLISFGSRFSLYLMIALCLPIILNVNYILSLWLGEVPQYTAEFVVFALIYILIIPFSNILDNVLMSTGKIKHSQIRLSVLQLCNLPLSCSILYFGCPPYMIYLSYIFISYLSLIVRIHYSAKYAGINIHEYLLNVLLKGIVVVAVVFMLTNILIHLIDIGNAHFRCIFNCFIAEIVFVVICVCFGMSQTERMWIFNKFLNIIR